jgi:hypothetical protein
MTNWMLRGLVFGAAMVVVRLFQGTLINVWQTHAGLISIALLLLFLVGVVAWGLIDGREDAAANPDPDRRSDLAMTWLLAGLVAGLLSGAVTWLTSVFYKALYVGGLINELTTFAAFTALVVFLGAISGVAVGRWRVDRAGAYHPQSGAGGGSAERADTDVFAAVQAPTAYSQEGVETAEAATPAYSEETTSKIPWPPHSDEKTVESHAHEASESATEHIEKPKSDDH